MVPLQLDIAVRASARRALGIAFTQPRQRQPDDEGGAVALDGLKMEVFGGRFAGSAEFDGAQRVPGYEWRGTFENLDVPALVAFAGSPGSMTGRLAGIGRARRRRRRTDRGDANARAARRAS